MLFKYCAEEVAQARHTALFQRFIKVCGCGCVWWWCGGGGELDVWMCAGRAPRIIERPTGTVGLVVACIEGLHSTADSERPAELLLLLLLLLQALTRGPRPIEAHAHDPRRYDSGERDPVLPLAHPVFALLLAALQLVTAACLTTLFPVAR